MRATEFVNEAVDLVSPKADWKITPQFSTATWMDKTGSRIEVNFLKVAPGVVELGFSGTDKDGVPSYKRTNTAKTGGSAIFGQVAATLRDFMAKNPDITTVTFKAVDDPSRSKLYSKIVQRAGILGLQRGTTSDLPKIMQQQHKADRIDKISRNTIDRIPSSFSKNSNTLPPPPSSIQIGPAPPSDRFVLKRTAVTQPAIPRPAVAQPAPKRISGNEYTNTFGGGKEPTNFQNQQYIKDIRSRLQQFPNDANLQAELDSWTKRAQQTDQR